MNFYKYQGAGNDFIMVDDRKNAFHNNDSSLIAQMCNRRYGIGADGLILLRNSNICDFSMLYFNSDGKEGTMCGNGGRCIVAFARDMGIFSSEMIDFEAIDGVHRAYINDNIVRLGMKNVEDIKLLYISEININGCFLDTGSPHFVVFLEKDTISEIDVKKMGSEIRNSRFFAQNGGTNVNFAFCDGENIVLRTYERGVEDETLACGTGATAVAISAYHRGMIKNKKVPLKALGGHLTVDFECKNEKYENIFLTGEAKKVFQVIF